MFRCGQGPKAGASVAQAEHNPAAAIMEQPMLDPHSNGIGPDFDFCRKYVWTNLLYVSNLYPHQFGINPQVFMEVEYPDQHGHMVKHKVPDYMDRPNLGCMGHSWYLSNDFQMHMLTPWLLLLFRKNNAAGYLLMSPTASAPHPLRALGALGCGSPSSLPRLAGVPPRCRSGSTS